MMWQIGDTLNGQYRIERRLNSGRYGTTYLARDDRDRRWVIKTPSDELLSNLATDKRQALERKFQEEADRISECNHPHVVSAKGAFREGDRVCIPMQYIDGVDLESRATRQLEESEALTYIRQIGDALQAVHKCEIVHRDVKPANIVVRSGKPEAVLIDFGLARGFAHPLTSVKSTTEDGYAPIELYYPDGKRGPYTDVYSLAATLYNLLTGEVPPSAEKRAAGSEKLIDPKQINARISDATNDAILEGMKLGPQERPATVEAWLNLLPSPDPEPTPDDGIRWAQIGVWIAILTLVVTILGVIPAWLGLFGDRDSQPTPDEISD